MIIITLHQRCSDGIYMYINLCKVTRFYREVTRKNWYMRTIKAVEELLNDLCINYKDLKSDNYIHVVKICQFLFDFLFWIVGAIYICIIIVFKILHHIMERMHRVHAIAPLTHMVVGCFCVWVPLHLFACFLTWLQCIMYAGIDTNLCNVKGFYREAHNTRTPSYTSLKVCRCCKRYGDTIARGRRTMIYQDLPPLFWGACRHNMQNYCIDGGRAWGWG
jgi:hypothetical protein